MILDSLENCGLYFALHPRFRQAFQYIRSTDLMSLPAGRHAIDGDDIFVNIMEVNLKNPEEAPLEVHDGYIDIQVVLEKEETYGWTERSRCSEPRGPMDSEKDVQFFDGPHSLRFTLQAGDFCIFFPSDGHAPMIGDPAVAVKKCIVKVRV